MNRQFYRDQSVLNGGNVVIGAGTVDFKEGNTAGNNLERIQISNVQQLSDRAYFNNDGRWVESQVAMKAGNNKAALQPKRTIEFGSDEFMELAQKLAKEGRQSSISLRGEILLEVGKEVVLVRNPLAPSDVAVAHAQNASVDVARTSDLTKEAKTERGEASARRSESPAAAELIRATE
jgi:hypothetical protein